MYSGYGLNDSDYVIYAKTKASGPLGCGNGDFQSIRVGGAAVSRRHANFILNTGGASAADVHALIELVSARVHADCGLRLEPEIAFLDNHEPRLFG